MFFLSFVFSLYRFLPIMVGRIPAADPVPVEGGPHPWLVRSRLCFQCGRHYRWRLLPLLVNRRQPHRSADNPRRNLRIWLDRFRPIEDGLRDRPPWFHGRVHPKSSSCTWTTAISAVKSTSPPTSFSFTTSQSCATASPTVSSARTRTAANSNAPVKITK